MRVEKTVEPPIKPVEQAPQPIAKVSTLVVLVLVSAALFWWSVHRLFLLDIPLNDLKAALTGLLGPLLFFAASFGVFLGVAGFSFNVLTKFWARLVPAILGGVVYFVFFPVSIFGFIAVLATALILVQWSGAVHGDAKSRQSITVVRSSATGLSSTVAVILLAVALTYYASLTHGDPRTTKFREGLVDNSVGIMNQVLMKQFRGYRSDMTLDEFIVNFGVKGLEQNLGSVFNEQKQNVDQQAQKLKNTPAPKGLPPEFQKLFKEYQGKAPGEIIPQSAIDEALKKAEGQVVAQIRQQFLDTFGVQAKGTDTMQFVLHQFLDRKVTDLLGPYLKYIPILFAVSVYFLLQFISVIYILFARLATVVFYQVLRLLKFVHVETVQIPAERLRL